MGKKTFELTKEQALDLLSVLMISSSASGESFSLSDELSEFVEDIVDDLRAFILEGSSPAQTDDEEECTQSDCEDCEDCDCHNEVNDSDDEESSGWFLSIDELENLPKITARFDGRKVKLKFENGELVVNDDLIYTIDRLKRTGDSLIVEEEGKLFAFNVNKFPPTWVATLSPVSEWMRLDED